LIAFPLPTPLFNPDAAASDQLLTPAEIFAGPFGLLAYVPFVPVALLIARRSKPAALLLTGLTWLVATLSPAGAGVLIAGVAAAAGWVLVLRAWRAAGRLSAGGMIAGVWIGLSAMILPLWWTTGHVWCGWGGSRMAALHVAGFAYFYLRLISWGVDLAHAPNLPRPFWTTLSWLAYPPCMRLGPVMRYGDFEARYAAWDPRVGRAWGEIGARLGWMVLGVAALALTEQFVRIVAPGSEDFYAAPQQYSTAALVRLIYVIPVRIYLLLWIYNELAAAVSRMVGIPVDNNFNWLPAATSVREFWRRWHITVGAWLRDYVYIPVGGNRVPLGISYGAVFGFCAVWHGAAWSFLVWAGSQVLALWVQKRWDVVRARVEWTRLLRGPVWVAGCWLVTMHYQVLTIFIFADFQYSGWRVLRELARRALV